MTVPAKSRSPIGLEECIRLACLMEATARKPGNVHPQAAFADLCYRDFVVSAEIVPPILARAPQTGVGRTILDAVTRTAEGVGRNTNLGIVLLIAPLAAVPRDVLLLDGITEVLDRLTTEDASLVYRAVRVAMPGGMGKVAEQDISGEPTATLRDVMRLAADRDSIAAQYASGFRLVLEIGMPLLEQSHDFAGHWEESLIGLHLKLMAECPDTLIARKCGVDEAQRSASLARAVLDDGWPVTQSSRRKLGQLDGWLRETGNRRNPGTTADLVTASLFAALRDGRLEAPPFDPSSVKEPSGKS